MNDSSRPVFRVPYRRTLVNSIVKQPENQPSSAEQTVHSTPVSLSPFPLASCLFFLMLRGGTFRKPPGRAENGIHPFSGEQSGFHAGMN